MGQKHAVVIIELLRTQTSRIEVLPTWVNNEHI